MDRLQMFEDDGNTLVLDARYFPIVVTGWHGKPTDGLAEKYFEWVKQILQRSREEGTDSAFITDALDAARPQPTVRRRINELMSEVEEDSDRYSLGYGYVVIASAIIRGSLTALGWVNPWMKIRSAASLAEAFRKARADLAERGVRADAIAPEEYERVLPKSAATG